MTAFFAAATLAIWSSLFAARGAFWRAAERDTRFAPDNLPAPAQWPRVVAIVPARDEADVIEESVSSLLVQDYPGKFSVVLVDDQSADGTRHIAGTVG